MKSFAVALRTFAAASLCSLLINIELFYLKNTDIASLFCSILYNVDVYLEEKKLFLVLNVLFALIFSCYLCSNSIADYYTIYTSYRIKSKNIFFFKKILSIVGRQAVFGVGYCITLLLLCGISCREMPDLECMKYLVKYIIAITYSGAFFGIVCCTLTVFFDSRIAVLVIMILMLSLSFISMMFSDFLGSRDLLLIMNPITTITIISENAIFKFVKDCLIIMSVLFLETIAAITICKRKELS